MSASHIYVKTPKGIEELNNRTFGLPQRARLVLIAMDGKRSHDDVAAMFPDGEGEALLADLIVGEFVTVLQPSSDSGKSLEKFEPPKDDTERFEIAKKLMRNTINAFLSGMGSGLISQLDKCTHLEELRQHFEAWQEAILLTSEGCERAEELENRLAALLS